MRLTVRHRSIKVIGMIIGLGLLCTLLGLWAYDRYAPAPEISCARRDQIQKGMTAREVEAIIGGPPGNYSGILFRSERYENLDVKGATRTEHWHGRRATISVYFDASGRVIEASCIQDP
jgi:hypothetical protein